MSSSEKAPSPLAVTGNAVLQRRMLALDATHKKRKKKPGMYATADYTAGKANPSPKGDGGR